MQPCILIPHYNHELQIPAVLAALDALCLPVIVVDDGSTPASFRALQSCVDGRSGIELHREPANGGKGAAVMRGLRLAAARGYTHAVQFDADGQHCVADIPAMLEAAQREPLALVSGQPVYDSSVPRARLHGRKIGVFWTKVHTLSTAIADPMCGFRVYPVQATLDLVARTSPGAGMEFDTEILVQAHWAGLPIRFMPTSVTYPAGGVSHFRLVRDNFRITAMHARLFIGMLRRVPLLLARRWRALEP